MDAAHRDLWCEQPDAACFRRIARLWERSGRLSPRRFPKGVIKYRSLEEAQADRERWQTEHVREVQHERQQEGKVRIVQPGRPPWHR
jgi:hypothetical protein